MDACEFSYIRTATSTVVTAVGVERAWDDLKIEFGRIGPGIPGATYFKRISEKGPELFAVLGPEQVFYHDEGKWFQYITAFNVRFFQLENPNRRPNEDELGHADGEIYGTEEDGTY